MTYAPLGKKSNKSKVATRGEMVPEKHEKREDETFAEAIITELRRMGVASPEKAVEEFELLAISESDEDAGLMRAVAKKARDRVDTYAKLLEDLIQPDSSLATMNECGFFSDEEMERIIKGYRKLMAIVRQFAVADLAGTAKAYEAFVKDALPAWKEQQSLLQLVTKRLHDGWTKEQPLQREKGYFG